MKESKRSDVHFHNFMVKFLYCLLISLLFALLSLGILFFAVDKSHNVLFVFLSQFVVASFGDLDVLVSFELDDCTLPLGH
jgi:cytochrome b561